VLEGYSLRVSHSLWGVVPRQFTTNRH